MRGGYELILHRAQLKATIVQWGTWHPSVAPIWHPSTHPSSYQRERWIDHGRMVKWPQSG
jgi:hypothetical protein